MVTKGGKYFKCRCPCAEKHYVSVVLTPSSQRTLLETKKRFQRSSCWKEGRQR
jgi:hypothetical protein